MAAVQWRWGGGGSSKVRTWAFAWSSWEPQEGPGLLGLFMEAPRPPHGGHTRGQFGGCWHVAGRADGSLDRGEKGAHPAHTWRAELMGCRQVGQGLREMVMRSPPELRSGLSRPTWKMGARADMCLVTRLSHAEVSQALGRVCGGGFPHRPGLGSLPSLVWLHPLTSFWEGGLYHHGCSTPRGAAHSFSRERQHSPG